MTTLHSRLQPVPRATWQQKSCLYRWLLHRFFHTCEWLSVFNGCVYAPSLCIKCNWVTGIIAWHYPPIAHSRGSICLIANDHTITKHTEATQNTFNGLRLVWSAAFWQNDLQILCFPFMGNFTTSSWGLVQMKTKGEADSSQVSGNCRWEIVNTLRTGCYSHRGNGGDSSEHTAHIYVNPSAHVSWWALTFHYTPDIKPSLSSHTSSVVLQCSTVVMNHLLHHIAVVHHWKYYYLVCEREKYIIWVTAGKAFIGPWVEDNYTK